MSNLPDEIWTQILELGIHNPNPNPNGRLTYKDICRISLCSRRLNRLTNDPLIWSSLLYLDFPARLSNRTVQENDGSPKLLYKLWFEKEKSRRVASEKRALMRVQSRVSEGVRRVDVLRKRRVSEGERVRVVARELNDLCKVRQASVALNVWQPEVVRGRQKQIVEQCAVPVDSRINALKMELKLCKQQMTDLEHAEPNYEDLREQRSKSLSQTCDGFTHIVDDGQITKEEFYLALLGNYRQQNFFVDKKADIDTTMWKESNELAGACRCLKHKIQGHQGTDEIDR